MRKSLITSSLKFATLQYHTSDVAGQSAAGQLSLLILAGMSASLPTSGYGIYASAASNSSGIVLLPLHTYTSNQ